MLRARADGRCRAPPRAPRSSSSSGTAACTRWRRGTSRTRPSRTGPAPRRLARAVAPAPGVPRRPGARDDVPTRCMRWPRATARSPRGRATPDTTASSSARRTRSCSTSSCRPSTTAAPTSSAARSNGRAALLRPIRIADRRARGRRLPVHGQGPGRDRAARLRRARPRDEALRLCTLVEDVGLRRGHARRGVGVPRHDAVARRHSRLVLDESVDGDAAAGSRAAAVAGARSSRAVRGWAPGERRSAPVWNRELFAAAKRAGRTSPCSPSAASAPQRRCTRSSTGRSRHGRDRPARSTRSPTSPRRVLAGDPQPAALPELEPLRRRPDARHEGRLLQPRGPQAAADLKRRGHLHEVVGLGPGRGHLLPEAVERPRPHGGDAAVVEVPAAAAGDPHRASCAASTRSASKLLHRRTGRADLAALRPTAAAR